MTVKMGFSEEKILGFMQNSEERMVERSPKGGRKLTTKQKHNKSGNLEFPPATANANEI